MRIRLFLALPLVLLVFPVNASEVTAFVSPDSSYSTLSRFLEGSKSLYIASYTFNSPFIMDELLQSNANITLIVEKSPVGGLPEENKEIFCNLEEKGIHVYLYDGPYRFMHAKYIIKNENSVLLSTENLGESGFPRENNHGNRGWGLIVEEENTAKVFSEIFFKDLADSKRFSCSLDSYEIDYEEESGNYDPVFGISSYSNQRIDVIFAPDAVDEIVNLIKTAEESIYVEQFYIYKHWSGKENLFLEAIIEKARQGIDVKVLLDSYWHNIQESDSKSNFHTNNYINEIAEKENLSLEARLIDLSNGLEKLHAKIMIIDNQKVLVSTINWNENSPRNNREAGIVVTGSAADYFTAVFNYDWSGEKQDTISNQILILSIILILVLVILIIRIIKEYEKGQL